MQNNNLPIGIFDSGVGGVSVLKELVSLMPGENYIYLGDSKNAPYGTKSREEILENSLACAQFLTDRGVKALMVACNTATSVCISELRKIYPNMPVVGVEPAIKPALEDKNNSVIVVMATPLTLKEAKFKNLLEKYRTDDAQIIPLPCPGLMEIVEKGLSDRKEAYTYLEDLFSSVRKPQGVVLGCTHYPFVKKAIKKVLGDVSIYDGGVGAAKQLKRLLTEQDLISDRTEGGEVEFVNTLNSARQNELASMLLKSDNS